MTEPQSLQRDLRDHVRFHVRFRWLDPYSKTMIVGEALGEQADGPTESVVLDRLTEKVAAAGWQPPTRKLGKPRFRYG